MSLTIDIHALHSLPPSNINRDDTGAPKSAIFGGVPRQRVSSQAWKRAIRRHFEEKLPAGTVGFRTKQAVKLIADSVVEQSASNDDAWSVERAQAAASNLLKAAGIKVDKPRRSRLSTAESTEEAPADETGYLLFISPRQISQAAEHIIATDGAKPSKKEAAAIIDANHSIDIAMFGRMVADDASYNVDASVQVAHALAIHESEIDFDYFTAVDDVAEDEEETGAGMIGTLQMMSSTLYRFATVDVDSLRENLGDEDVSVAAVTAFITAFVESMPTGKLNTFANTTLPELVYVAVRDTRSVSLVNAFEQPVRAGDGESRRALGAQRLAAEAEQVATQYGFTPRAAFVLGLGELTAPFAQIAERITLPQLADRVRETLETGESA